MNEGRPKISIIIPTLNHLTDLLKPNLESLVTYTEMASVEVIVVANGCTDGTEDYVRSLGTPFKVLSYPKAIGYTKATNEGIKVATGDFLVFLNNDVVFLGQPKNLWIDMLLAPFKADPKTGITGPHMMHCIYTSQYTMTGFCLCISREALTAAGGLLDEIYSPGGGEDVDICCKVIEKGYQVCQVPKMGRLDASSRSPFPLWHKNNQTFKDVSGYWDTILKKNGLINVKKHNKNIKLSVGPTGPHYQGYRQGDYGIEVDRLSADLHDGRASLIMDMSHLDFEDNSVVELIAINVFERLSLTDAQDTLKRWFRVLKPGGKLIMEMPDIELLCNKFVSDDRGNRNGVVRKIYGSEQADTISTNLYGWWKQALLDCLGGIGFSNITCGAGQIAHQDSNLHVEAEKR